MTTHKQTLDSPLPPPPEPVLSLIRVLGKGTCGKVYLAELNGDVVAAKVIETQNDNLIKYIRNEKLILEHVKHDLIV